MDLDSLKDIIGSESGVMLYFSGKECNVCHALRPKIKALFDKEFPKIRQIYLDAHETPEISAYFQVFSVPTMIVFLQGCEFAREGRAVSLHKLAQQLRRPYEMLEQ